MDITSLGLSMQQLKKMRLQNKNVEAEILESLALLAELGLNSINSAKIYLAGIKSRVSANELSSKIDAKSSHDIKALLEYFYGKCLSGEEICSKLCLRWLKIVLTKRDVKESIVFEKKEFKYSKDIGYDRLYIKTHEQELKLCSFDYKKILSVNQKLKSHLTVFADREDIYLQKNNYKWVTETNNPYIVFKGD